LRLKICPYYRIQCSSFLLFQKIFVSKFKVHLTPFFFAKKILHALLIIYSKKFLILSNPQFFYAPLMYGNRTEIAAILAHDRVSRVKGLVTAVTSL